MASTASPFPVAPPPAIFQQRRVDALLSLQQAAQQIGSILELDSPLRSKSGGGGFEYNRPVIAS